MVVPGSWLSGVHVVLVSSEGVESMIFVSLGNGTSSGVLSVSDWEINVFPSVPVVFDSDDVVVDLLESHIVGRLDELVLPLSSVNVVNLVRVLSDKP